MNVSDSGAKMGNLPPMVLGNGYSGAKVGDVPPMMSENGYSGAKVGDLPPMVSGGISLCRFLLVL